MAESVRLDGVRERALRRLGEFLAGLDREASVQIVPAGRTPEQRSQLPWPLGPSEQKLRRRQLLDLLAGYTCAASVRVVRQGETASRAWVLHWPQAEGLFDREDRESAAFVRMWLDGTFQPENGEAKAGKGEPRDRAAEPSEEDGPPPPPRSPAEEAAELPPLLRLQAPPGPARQDCLDDLARILREAGRRLSASQIVQQVILYGMRWGKATVEASLKWGHETGQFAHGRGGYGLPDRGPDEVYTVRE